MNAKNDTPIPPATPSGDADASRLKSLFVEVIAPVLLSGRSQGPAPDLPRRALEILDRIGDVEARGGEILSLLESEGTAERAGNLISADDTITKSDRTVTFRISGKRTVPIAGAGIDLDFEGPFALEFRSAAEGFADAAVQARFSSARASLPVLNPADILAAAVLPQSKTLLGVNTPVKVSLLGIPFSLRFGILAAQAGRLRLFAAGPLVKEVPL